jgi:hypothetical protein
MGVFACNVMGAAVQQATILFKQIHGMLFVLFHFMMLLPY